MIFMVVPDQGPKPGTGLRAFHTDEEKEISTMIDITARPTWQWSSKNANTPSTNTRTNHAGAIVIKQTLLPRSLDLAFSLKYRR
jgi:hypothetical protein